MIVANEPYTNQLYLQKSTWFLFTSVYFDTTVFQEVQLIKLKTKQWNPLSLRLFSLSPWLPDLFKPYGACVKRGSGKRMFRLSLFRPSRQSNISTSGKERFKYPLAWDNKISQMPYPRDNKDNQILTPSPFPASFTLIGALLSAIFFELPITRTFFNFPWRFELSRVDCITSTETGVLRNHKPRSSMQYGWVHYRFNIIFSNINWKRHA